MIMMCVNDEYKRWKEFSYQCTIEDLRKVIELEHCSDLSREEIRDGFNQDLNWSYYLDDWSARKFIKCYLVEMFLSPRMDEWVTPKDLLRCGSYNPLFVFYGSYKPIINEFEILRAQGYLEKHPDDEKETENTRYRIKL